MRKAWDARALSDPLYAVDARRRKWDLEDFYSQGPLLVEQYVDPALDLLSVDPSGLRVLEVGCGLGRLFGGLSARFGEVWGIDISREMLTQGQAHCRVAANWILGDGVSLEGIGAETVDYVVSFEVFGHITRPSIIQDYFSEILRVLTPGGAFQAQLRRASDSVRQAVVRSMPRPARVASAAALRRLQLLPVEGDIDTWLGCIVAPDDALAMLKDIGFPDAQTHRSDFGEGELTGMGYWVVGRKPASGAGPGPRDDGGTAGLTWGCGSVGHGSECSPTPSPRSRRCRHPGLPGLRGPM